MRETTLGLVRDRAADPRTGQYQRLERLLGLWV